MTREFGTNVQTNRDRDYSVGFVWRGEPWLPVKVVNCSYRVRKAVYAVYRCIPWLPVKVVNCSYGVRKAVYAVLKFLYQDYWRSGELQIIGCSTLNTLFGSFSTSRDLPVNHGRFEAKLYIHYTMS